MNTALTPTLSRARAVVALYFVGFGLPLLLLGASLGVDLTQLVSEHRRVTNAAESAAEAGALAIDQQTGYLDLAGGPTGLGRAFEQAIGTFDTARAIGAIRGTNVSPNISFENASGQTVSFGADDATTVRVEVSYTNSRMTFLPALMRVAGHNPETQLSLTTVGVASICEPGRPGPTGGTCTRPLR